MHPAKWESDQYKLIWFFVECLLVWNWILCLIFLKSMITFTSFDWPKFHLDFLVFKLKCYFVWSHVLLIHGLVFHFDRFLWILKDADRFMNILIVGVWLLHFCKQGEHHCYFVFCMLSNDAIILEKPIWYDIIFIWLLHHAAHIWNEIFHSTRVSPQICFFLVPRVCLKLGDNLDLIKEKSIITIF